MKSSNIKRKLAVSVLSLVLVSPVVLGLAPVSTPIGATQVEAAESQENVVEVNFDWYKVADQNRTKSKQAKTFTTKTSEGKEVTFYLYQASSDNFSLTYNLTDSDTDFNYFVGAPTLAYGNNEYSIKPIYNEDTKKYIEPFDWIDSKDKIKVTINYKNDVVGKEKPTAPSNIEINDEGNSVKADVSSNAYWYAFSEEGENLLNYIYGDASSADDLNLLKRTLIPGERIYLISYDRETNMPSDPVWVTFKESEVKENELKAQKDSAKKELAAYKNTNEYRKKEQNEMATILKEANNNIEKAKDLAEIDNTVKVAKDKLDALKTDKELKILEKNPQGAYIPHNKYVTITSNSYETWSNFKWKKRNDASKVSGKTYLAKGKYNHSNGQTYLSLFDDKGNWQGYINEKASKAGSGRQGAYLNHNKYVSITKNYDTWSSFNWKKRQPANKVVGKTYLAKGKYHHINGQTYLSLFDDKGNWHGYINEKASKVASGKQGSYISYGKYVTVTSENYETWTNFNWKKRQSAIYVSNQTYLAKGKYNHVNGQTYLSLFDTKGNWQGYINEKAAKVGASKQGAYIADGRKIVVNKKGYNTWQNFGWKKKGTTSNLVGKEYTAKAIYFHHNGSTYYSLFDNKNNWMGYLNTDATKVVEGKFGARPTINAELDRTYGGRFEFPEHARKVGNTGLTFPTEKDAENYFYEHYKAGNIIDVKMKKTGKVRYTIYANLG
ncbi:hypothetical protein [Vagococcus carniphilus]|uniref:hypothetical protein n=1 Tax=Vagococcus carniphilus TaxID=218144 RepID=UPI003BAACFB4